MSELALAFVKTSVDQQKDLKLGQRDQQFEGTRHLERRTCYAIVGPTYPISFRVSQSYSVNIRILQILQCILGVLYDVWAYSFRADDRP
jgi:hypothetical protein